MRTIRIDFCDFWDGFSKTDNPFVALLRQRYRVEICDRPEFLFFASHRLHQHRVANCIKIYFGVESDLPDWTDCDFALTCHHMDDARQARLPYYVFGSLPEEFDKANLDVRSELARKEGFCSFLVSNVGRAGTPRRIEFFKALSRYKRVESGGRALNNIGEPVPPGHHSKRDFLGRCKFHIAFENKSLPGYTTEKIADAFKARTVPIYWGDPRIAEQFDPRSFINAHEFESDDALIERIIEVDQDDSQYLAMLKQPVLVGGNAGGAFNPERLLDFFERVFSSKAPPVSSRRKWFHVGRWRMVKFNTQHAKGGV